MFGAACSVMRGKMAAARSFYLLLPHPERSAQAGSVHARAAFRCKKAASSTQATGRENRLFFHADAERPAKPDGSFFLPIRQDTAHVLAASIAWITPYLQPNAWAFAGAALQKWTSAERCVRPGAGCSRYRTIPQRNHNCSGNGPLRCTARRQLPCKPACPLLQATAGVQPHAASLCMVISYSCSGFISAAIPVQWDHSHPEPQRGGFSRLHFQ